MAGAQIEPVRFELPGYIRCLGPFVQAVNRAVVSSSPLIGEIAERPTRHRGPIRNAPQPNPVEHRSEPLTINYEVSFDIIRNGQVEAFVELLIQQANEQFIGGLERQFIRAAQDVTHASGRVIDANGEPLSFDHVIDLVESVEISSDESGALRMPTIMMNPETRKIVERLQPTPEQHDRLNAVLRKKHEENLRNRKTRRIGR